MAVIESPLCKFFLFSVVIFGGTDLVPLGENLVTSPTYGNQELLTSVCQIVDNTVFLSFVPFGRTLYKNKTGYSVVLVARYFT